MNQKFIAQIGIASFFFILLLLLTIGFIYEAITQKASPESVTYLNGTLLKSPEINGRGHGIQFDFQLKEFPAIWFEIDDMASESGFDKYPASDSVKISIPNIFLERLHGKWKNRTWQDYLHHRTSTTIIVSSLETKGNANVDLHDYNDDFLTESIAIGIFCFALWIGSIILFIAVLRHRA